MAGFLVAYLMQHHCCCEFLMANCCYRLCFWFDTDPPTTGGIVHASAARSVLTARARSTLETCFSLGAGFVVQRTSRTAVGCSVCAPLQTKVPNPFPLAAPPREGGQILGSMPPQDVQEGGDKSAASGYPHRCARGISSVNLFWQDNMPSKGSLWVDDIP